MAARAPPLRSKTDPSNSVFSMVKVWKLILEEMPSTMIIPPEPAVEQPLKRLLLMIPEILEAEIAPPENEAFPLENSQLIIIKVNNSSSGPMISMKAPLPAVESLNLVDSN